MAVPELLVAISACKGIIGCILNNFVKTNNDTTSASEHDTFIRKRSDVNELDEFYIGGIDDVIYEEFNYCNLNDCEDDDEEKCNIQRKWVMHRPPLYDWLYECIKYSIAIVLLSGCFIGICNTIILIGLITTAGACPEHFQMRNETVAIFHKNISAESVAGWFIQFMSLSSMYLAFGWEIIVDLQLFIFNLSGAFLDTIFRFYLVVFNTYADWRHYPLNAIFFILLMYNCYQITNYFYKKNEGQCSRFSLFWKLSTQFIACMIYYFLLNYLIISIGYREFNWYQVYIAAVIPIINMILRFVVRIISINISHVNHPGCHYAFIIYVYAGNALAKGVFHAKIHTFEIYLLFCLANGFVGLFEQLFLNFKNRLFKCISLNIFKKDAMKFFKTSKRTPRMQRILADITICKFIQDINAFIYANAFVAIYLLKFGQDGKPYTLGGVLVYFFARVFVGVGIEFVLCTYSIFSLTWYRNIPLIKVWKSKWRRLLLANLMCSSIQILYFTEYLLTVVVTQFQGDSQLNKTEVIKRCHELEYLYFKKVKLDI